MEEVSAAPAVRVARTASQCGAEGEGAQGGVGAQWEGVVGGLDEWLDGDEPAGEAEQTEGDKCPFEAERETLDPGATRAGEGR